MASRRPLVIVSGQFSELPAGDTVIAGATLAAGSGLSGGGALTGSTVTLDVSLATNASGLIFVGDALGIDGVVQTVASAAQASGNAALDKAINTSEWVLGANGTSDYTFTGPGFSGGENDPLIYLTRGQQYKFTNTMGAHPFRIQSTPNGSVGTQYNAGVTNNDVSNGTLIWNVQFDAPNTLYYQCTSHNAMGGPFYIVDNTASAALASGNAALSTKYDKTGGVLSGTVIVNKQSFGTINTVTSSGVLLVDFSTGNNFTVTLASNATFASPINASGGQCGAIAIRQDNTGSRTLAYSGSWAFQGGTAPTLTTAASGIDILSYYVLAPTRVIGILTAAYSGGSQ